MDGPWDKVHGELRAARVVQAHARAQERRMGAPLPAHVQRHRIDGLWSEVRLRRLERDAAVSDVVRRRLMSSADRALPKKHDETCCIDAHAKRQLDGRTLCQHGLAGS